MIRAYINATPKEVTRAVISGSGLNQIDETLLADGNYVGTEEGYIISEQDNNANLIIEETEV